MQDAVRLTSRSAFAADSTLTAEEKAWIARYLKIAGEAEEQLHDAQQWTLSLTTAIGRLLGREQKAQFRQSPTHATSQSENQLGKDEEENDLLKG